MFSDRVCDRDSSHMNFMATILLMIMLCTVQTLDDWIPNTTHVIDSHLFSQRFSIWLRTQCQCQSSQDSTPPEAEQPLPVQQLLRSQYSAQISLSIHLTAQSSALRSALTARLWQTQYKSLSPQIIWKKVFIYSSVITALGSHPFISRSRSIC